MRLKERFIPREWIIASVNGYELIESYPRDKYAELSGLFIFQ